MNSENLEYSVSKISGPLLLDMRLVTLLIILTVITFAKGQSNDRDVVADKDVLAAEKKLAELGFWIKKIDNTADESTYYAVFAFQRISGSIAEPLTDEIIKGFNFNEANKTIKAFVTLHSTQRGEFAYEYFDKDVGQWRGYFSRAVEEGLTGKAANEKGEITLAGLVKYVEEIVPERSYINLNKRQIPWKVSNGGYKENQLILAIAK